METVDGAHLTDDAIPDHFFASFPTLHECVTALSSDVPEIRAGAAEALLEVPVAGTRQGDRGTPWAYALIATGAIVPLLGLIQAVKRDGAEGLKPRECPENTEPVLRAGDFALLVLSEIAEVASALLADEGWEVRYDEQVNRPVFLDERSGMQQSSPPVLRVTSGDWVASMLVEVTTLLQPLDIDSGTGMPRWPVSVLCHIPVSPHRPCTISVLDIVDEGETGECTRVLIRGPWAGSNGEVDGEVDPKETPGTALDGWHDATTVAALVPHLNACTWSPMNPPRVLILGLRCGAVPAFLCKYLPGVRVDVVEPDEEIVKIAKDFFSLKFEEVRWSSLDESYRITLLSTPPSEGTFRVFVGVSALQFLNVVPGNSNFLGLLGNMPDPVELDAGDMHKFQSLALSTIKNNQKFGFVALAARSRTSLQEAAAALSCAWRRYFSRTLILCDPKDQKVLQNNDGTNTLTKFMKRTLPQFGSFEWEALHFDGAPTSGGVFICLPFQGEEDYQRETPLDFFNPSTWHAQLELFLRNRESSSTVTANRFPFALESSMQNPWIAFGDAWPARSNGRVLHVRYCVASESKYSSFSYNPHERSTLIAEKDDATGDTFSNGICEITPTTHFEENTDDVLSTKYWEGIFGNKLSCKAQTIAEPSYRSSSVAYSRYCIYRKDIEEQGYTWGDVVVTESESKHLANGIQQLVAAGWPPVCIFVSDLAWSVTDHLWSYAEAILGAGNEIVLEPSLAAFKLDPRQDHAGKRYVGNNFGQPHRDYSHEEVFGSDISEASKSLNILSIWLPLVDISLENGCMYVVPRSGDRSGGSGENEVDIPLFDMKTVQALAPTKAGTLLAWAGNTVHWGASCVKRDEKSPRISLAYVFRKKQAVCDLRGEPLTREAFRAGLTMERRLELIRQSLSCFEHWYGDTTPTITKLGRPNVYEHGMI
jgi:ectoine hydroxylase-related dioxygenase (phytanoyl-CoA dioxygenase family)|tara:strand:+ start:667 stop:3471 length:2805 start_codon:yes stop_codon:yes gene_type:complete